MISANLAAALGEQGMNVIVMTAELRSPTIHRYFDAPAAPGIVDAIVDWDGSRDTGGSVTRRRRRTSP